MLLGRSVGSFLRLHTGSGPLPRLTFLDRHRQLPLSHKRSLSALVSTSVFSFSAETQFSEDRDYTQQQSKALLCFFPMSISYVKGQISQDEEKNQ